MRQPGQQRPAMEWQSMPACPWPRRWRRWRLSMARTPVAELGSIMTIRRPIATRCSRSPAGVGASRRRWRWRAGANANGRSAFISMSRPRQAFSVAKRGLRARPCGRSPRGASMPAGRSPTPPEPPGPPPTMSIGWRRSPASRRHAAGGGAWWWRRGAWSMRCRPRGCGWMAARSRSSVKSGSIRSVE